MASDLHQFLQAGIDLPFAWGESDCALWVCDWIKQRRGVDPVAGLRGRYRTRLGCARLLARHGGLLDGASALFVKAGLHTVNGFDARDGDVGYLDTQNGTLGILVGHERWACKETTGGLLMTAAYPVLRIWRV